MGGGEYIQIPAFYADLGGWFIGALVQFILTYGAFKLWQGDINARLKAVEGHGEKVDKIGSIETDIESMKQQFGVEFKNLREDIRELARSVQSLAMARGNVT